MVLLSDPHNVWAKDRGETGGFRGVFRGLAAVARSDAKTLGPRDLRVVAQRVAPVRL
jgi:hypothetical protein